MHNIIKKLALFLILISSPFLWITIESAASTKKEKGSDKSSTIIGIAGAKTPQKYFFQDGVSLNENLTVNGPVVIVSDGDFNIGNNTVEITSTGSLKIYVKGDMKISGNGSFNNTNIPEKLIILGTADVDEGQVINLNGNGLLAAAVYAPEAELTSNGGGARGALLGSAIAKSITFHGSPGPFHFDEALKELSVGNTTYSIEHYFSPSGANAFLMANPQKGTYAQFFAQQFRAD